MSAKVQELVNSLSDMVQNAWNLPMSTKCVINREELLDVIDEIIEKLPQEIKLANNIIEDRMNIINTAEREAAAIKKQAEAKMEKLVSQHEVTIEARRKSAEMIAVAEAKSKELRAVASDFCDKAFRDIEKDVSGALEEIRNGRKKVQELRRQQQM